jgi:carbon-monoxide dehydrogenase medium subunit
MLANIQRIIRPASIDEAVAYLRDGGGALKVMAGGTAPALFRSRQVEGAVDLWPLPLRYISVTDGQLCIGATTTLSDLERTQVVRSWATGALATAAGCAGSTPLRNMITAGGNLAGLYPWSDLPPVLLVLDARARVAGSAGPELTVAELVARHPSQVLGHDSIITEIVIPPCPETAAAVFHKSSESAVDYSWLDLAVLVEMEGGRCRTCRLAISAIEARCRRLPEVEELVTGGELDEAAATAAGELAARLVTPLADPRVSQDYRRHLLQVWCRRLLLQARDLATGAGGAA